jgi:hypothetical protein
MQIFRLSRYHLAEGAEEVEFPEKNAGSGVFKSSFGGRDPPVGSATRLVAILNHATLPRCHTPENEQDCPPVVLPKWPSEKVSRGSLPWWWQVFDCRKS